MNSEKLQALKNRIGIFCRALLVLFITAGLILLINLTVRFALPFLIACTLAFFLSPIVSFLSGKSGLPRGLSSFIVMFTLFSLSIGLMLATAYALIKGISSLTRSVPEELGATIGDLQTFFFTKLLPSWEKMTHLFSGISTTQQKALQLNMESIAATLIDFLNNLATLTLQSLTQFVASLPDTFISAVFIFLATFFITKDSEQIKKGMARFLLPAIHRPLIHVIQELKKTCIGFVRAQIILVTLTMILVGAALSVLQTGHAFTIAFFAGLVDLIPYLGTGVIFIPWILYEFIQHDYPLVLALSSLFGAIIIQRQLLEPKILSTAIGLDPLIALTALYFGFRWLGFAGLIIGPLSMVILKVLYQTGTFQAIWRFIRDGK
ncbi:MAG: sporulation integral membrane protein YtvI [Sporolactobacillus sp.]